ncbi:sulfatase 1 [Plakobranchus ocellatus]|uniref:Sulfatase 1 n=1 Tax=Plakobranchus ocellatus TaxID=259542 RepID=A0AAV3YHW2_9GAST|nr:sulfatase 1 [Plakobranchus ocellatus]
MVTDVVIAIVVCEYKDNVRLRRRPGFGVSNSRRQKKTSHRKHKATKSQRGKDTHVSRESKSIDETEKDGKSGEKPRERGTSVCLPDNSLKECDQRNTTCSIYPKMGL